MNNEIILEIMLVDYSDNWLKILLQLDCDKYPFANYYSEYENQLKIMNLIPKHITKDYRILWIRGSDVDYVLTA